jgi:hypothetical protein
MIRALMKKDYSGATAVMLAHCHQNTTHPHLSALSERYSRAISTFDHLHLICSSECGNQ